MKLGVILAGLAGLALAVYFIVHAGFGSVVAAVTSVGWSGFMLLCLYQLATFVVLGTAWFALTPEAGLWSFVWGRVVRDAAGEVLPFSQLGGIFFGVRALVLRGMAAPSAFASAIVDVTTEMMAQIVFTLIGIALFLAHSTRALPAATVSGVVFVLAGGFAFVVLQRKGIALAGTLAERFLPAAPSESSRNSPTSRPRSPTRPTTVTSAWVLRVIMPMRVLLPTPEPPKTPTRWPRPTVSSASMTRMPVPSGMRIGTRSSGGRTAPASGSETGKAGSGPASIGAPSAFSTRPISAGPTSISGPVPNAVTGSP